MNCFFGMSGKAEGIFVCDCSQGTNQWLPILYMAAGLSVFVILEWISRRKKMAGTDSKEQTSSGRSGAGIKAAIVAALILAVGVAIYAKNQQSSPAVPNSAATTIETAAVQTYAPAAGQPVVPESKTALPRLVDLGATKCIPCKMMAPILEELKKTYAGKLDVMFIDVWEKPDEAKKYNINLIPTQVFYDATGKERFRHEGFFSKEDILAKWKELSLEL